MSLATRCSACGTIFRVVEDQLRVSDGFVRCGRCAEVFDARAQIFDIEREAPPPWPPGAAAATPLAADEPAPVKPEPSHAPEPWQEERPEFEPKPAQFMPDQGDYPVEPALEAASARPPEAESENFQNPQIDSRLDSRLEPHWTDQAPAPAPPLAQPASGSERLSQHAAPPAFDLRADINERPDVVLAERLTQSNVATPANPEGTPVTPGTAASLPEFLRASATKTKWQSPKLRIGLSLLALLLLSALLLQVGLHFRNTLAAVQPGLRPALQAACAFGGCEISPRQHIEGIGVESSALNQAGPGNHYQLMIGLRNKSSTEVATPWVEVSLTDSAGELVAKRVLGPLDFKTDKSVMAAGSDLSLQTQLSTGSARVSGYSVEIFYP